MLKILSDADMIYGKIRKTQQWRLLRYLNDTLVQLFKPNVAVRYSRYNLSWHMLNQIRWDGRSIRSLSSFLSNIMHVSKSTIITFYLPYMLFMMKNKKLELNIDQAHDDIIQKEMGKIK